MNVGDKGFGSLVEEESGSDYNVITDDEPTKSDVAIELERIEQARLSRLSKMCRFGSHGFCQFGPHEFERKYPECQCVCHSHRA
jgi:hypothetical protein